MNWSLDVGRVFGIRIRLHYIFLLLLAVVFMVDTHAGGLVQGLVSVLFIVGVFTIVALHELAHCVVARGEGLQVLDITLLPIGGVARLKDLPERPASEIKVALAGPLLNFALAALGLPMLIAIIVGTMSFDLWRGGMGFFMGLFVVNLIMGMFNLLPAFPLDGGRILRALLAMRGDYVWATSVAAKVGQIMAIAMAAVGFAMNKWLVLLAVFVFFAGAQEERMVRARHELLERQAAAARFGAFGADFYELPPTHHPPATVHADEGLRRHLEQMMWMLRHPR